MSDNLTRDVQNNYLAMINGSVGTRMFQHLYVKNQAGETEDVMSAGELSCAYYVSSLLCLFGMIDRPHATVATTVQRMIESGSWERVAVSEPGDVVQWPENDDGHSHIGFVASDTECISNSWRLGYPIEHGFTMEDGRRPVAFWHYNRQ